jgi:glucose/arabinose dehydrogenase
MEPPAAPGTWSRRAPRPALTRLDDTWSYGLRNPFGPAFRPGTAQLFINDVGAGGFEEVNVASAAGANYGRPATEGDFDSVRFPAFTRPLYAYPHGDGSPQVGRSVVGAAFDDPLTPTFPAEYTGAYFFADLVGNRVNRLDPKTGRVAPFATELTGEFPVALATTAGGDLVTDVTPTGRPPRRRPRRPGRRAGGGSPPAR